MMKYYCNGKKGFCPEYKGVNVPWCKDCSYADGSGGNVVNNVTNYDLVIGKDVDEMAAFLMEFSTNLLIGKAPVDVKAWLEGEVKEGDKL